MNKLTNEEQNKELLKLVKEYPTLPVVFFCDSEDVCDDYGYTFMKFRRVEKGVIYESDINDTIYTSEDDYVEDLCDYFADDIRYANLTDAEYEKEMQKEAEKVPHYEAIIIYADVQKEVIVMNENLITMAVNQKTNAIDLYNFIQRYLPFDTVIELYKLIQYKLINLDDEPYNYCNLAKKAESDE